jgi:acyl dehydratase
MSVRVGQVASAKRTFTQSDFDRFAALSGDDNPIHVDPEFSAETKFGRTVAHGMFLYSVVCSVLGTRLPGPGTLHIEQELMFPTATPAGEEVEIRVEVTEVHPSEGQAELSTLVLRPNGTVGLQGHARVRLPRDSASLVTDSKIPDPRSRVPSSESFKGMALGQRAQIRRRFTAADLAEYADLTGDTNPVFTDAEYARGLGLNGPLVPGGLLAGLFSDLLGTELPGRGTNYLKQRLHFPDPAYVDQLLTASVEVIRFRPEKQLVNLSTVCTNAADSTACYGEALVLVSDVSSQ